MAGAPSVDLGAMTRVEGLLAAIGPIAGLRIVDIGCGEGEIAREFARQGATVAGYDPFLGELESDGPESDGPKSDWIELGSGAYRLSKASADAIPEPDGSADVVLFVFSLHHVPQPKLATALAEARRLLKPSGRLCVAEPLAEGPGQYIMELYHDETAVRRDAASALEAYAAPSFGSERILYFDEPREAADFDAFAQQALAGTRFNGYTEAEVLSPQVRRRFAEMLAAHGGRFDQPVRINLFA